MKSLLAMHRRLPLLAVLLFLSVQMLSLLHVAQHGFGEHAHNGVSCAMHHYSEHSPLLDAPEAAQLAGSPALPAATADSDCNIFCPAPIRSGEARAPPHA